MAKNKTKLGVIGVGSMGQHHARVYSEINGVELVGVADIDRSRASDVAERYETDRLDMDDLLASVDGVSVVVPTEYHHDLVKASLNKGVATFVEKPITESLDLAEDLLSHVKLTDVPLQVGHIERFNPAVSVLTNIVESLDLVSIRARRLGPELDRKIEDSVVIDLMIHDIDIVLSLFGSKPESVSGIKTQNGGHASALLEYEDDRMATLTASRKTQKKIRSLEVTAEDCFIEVDYLDQSIEIYRNSIPEYIEENGNIRFKHENIVERPTVQSGEPLRRELESFIRSVETGSTPEVTAQDGIDALTVALDIEEDAGGRSVGSNQ